MPRSEITRRGCASDEHQKLASLPPSPPGSIPEQARSAGIHEGDVAQAQDDRAQGGLKDHPRARRADGSLARSSWLLK
jgi:hypothetical protein